MNGQLVRMRQQLAANAEFCSKALEQMAAAEQHSIIILAILDELQRELSKADE